jgi:hypothetical protein
MNLSPVELNISPSRQPLPPHSTIWPGFNIEHLKRGEILRCSHLFKQIAANFWLFIEQLAPNHLKTCLLLNKYTYFLDSSRIYPASIRANATTQREGRGGGINFDAHLEDIDGLLLTKFPTNGAWGRGCLQAVRQLVQTIIKIWRRLDSNKLVVLSLIANCPAKKISKKSRGVCYG